MDRVVSRRAVADASDAYLPEQRHESPGVQALVGKADRPLIARHDDRRTDVTVAAGVDVRLQREPEDVSAAAL